LLNFLILWRGGDPPPFQKQKYIIYIVKHSKVLLLGINTLRIYNNLWYLKHHNIYKRIITIFFNMFLILFQIHNIRKKGTILENNNVSYYFVKGYYHKSVSNYNEKTIKFLILLNFLILWRGGGTPPFQKQKYIIYMLNIQRYYY
jgi:hypothetical protein